MGRIRTIKPEYWSHPIMARLPAETQLLGLALLNHADDHGYFHADPAVIRGACCPFREDLATISRDVARLSQVGWIEVRAHPIQGDIGWVVNWARHQKVDHPKPSKIDGYFIREAVAKPSRELREVVALDQGSGIRDQGRDQGASTPTPDPVTQPSRETPPGRDTFDPATFPGSPADVSAEDRWPYIQKTPWASRIGTVVGTAIHRRNWPAWERLVDAKHWTLEQVISAAEDLPARERWPDRVEEALADVPRKNLAAAPPRPKRPPTTIEQAKALVTDATWPACLALLDFTDRIKAKITNAEDLRDELDNEAWAKQLIERSAKQGAA